MVQSTPRSLADLRGARLALRAEQARVGRWRRLLRAQIDLTVAAVALPERLERNVGDSALPGAGLDLPDHLELVAAVRNGSSPSDLDRLGNLRDLDRRLASYQSMLGEVLDRATDELIPRLAADPAAYLSALFESR